MLHGIINEQEIDLIEEMTFQEKMNIFCMFSYKFLASGA